MTVCAERAGRPRLTVLALPLALALAFAVLLGGCDRRGGLEPGVVATVDGKPIRLAEVRARHDLGQLGLPVLENPTVERLRTEYGAVVADMIVARLAARELARRGLSVDDAAVARLQSRVRAEYGDAAFEQMLLEERIDLDRWRAVLADRLVLEKFSREVLRPDVHVDVSEAAAYYKTHIDEFTIPARVGLRRVGGADPEAVKAALAAYRASGPPALDGRAGVETREAMVPENTLPPAWRKAIKGLSPGQATDLLPGDGQAFFCILLDRRPAVVRDAAKAYAQVEAILSARKLETAMAAWLEAAMADGRVVVSRRLLAEAAAGAQKASAPAVPAVLPEPEPERQPPAVPPKSQPMARDDAGKNEAVVPPPADPVEAPAPARTPASRQESAEATPPSPARTPEPAAAPVAPETASEPTPEAAATGTEPAERAPAATPAGKTAETASTPAQAAAPAAEPAAADAGRHDGGTVELAAIKASWILYTVDEGAQERVYLKPGQPVRLTYLHKLIVQPGSPSELTYTVDGRETTVRVGKKERRILEFP